MGSRKREPENTVVAVTQPTSPFSFGSFLLGVMVMFIGLTTFYVGTHFLFINELTTDCRYALVSTDAASGLSMRDMWQEKHIECYRVKETALISFQARDEYHQRRTALIEVNSVVEAQSKEVWTKRYDTEWQLN